MNTQAPEDIHAITIRAGVEKAKAGDVEAALSANVLQSLASLKSAPDMLGAYLSLLDELIKSHKAIRKGDVEKAINALLPEDERDTAGRVNAADEIVAMVTDACTLFTDQEDEAHAIIEQDGCREVWPINSSTFKDWVARLIYITTQKTTRATSVADAFSTLNGIARHDSESHNVYLRVATDGGGGYYLDIGDEQWRVIHITANGWQIINESPVLFKRFKATKAVPIPQAGGTLADLKTLVNVGDDDNLLLVTALIDCMRPDTAYPVIELVGEQGSGKSTTAEHMRRLIDPKSVNLRGAPSSVEDLFVGARNNHIVCLNNLSRLSGAEQDALCNLSTGGGYASRKLYTNDDEVTYEAKRPTLLNGINAVATQPDLVSRVVRLECPTLDDTGGRLEDKELAEVFDKQAALALGFLLDTMTKALAILPAINLTDKPRLMDFAKLGAAVGRVLDPENGEQAFSTRYREAREAASLQALESMPVIVALLQYLEFQAPYTGSYAALLGDIESKIGKTTDAAWPKSAKGLSSAIGRAKPVLSFLGWVVVPTTRDSSGARVTIKKNTLPVKINNPDSTYTTCTTYTESPVSVGRVDGVDDSSVIYNHPKNKKTHTDEQHNATSCETEAEQYRTAKSGSQG